MLFIFYHLPLLSQPSPWQQFVAAIINMVLSLIQSERELGFTPDEAAKVFLAVFVLFLAAVVMVDLARFFSRLFWNLVALAVFSAVRAIVIIANSLLRFLYILVTLTIFGAVVTTRVAVDSLCGLVLLAIDAALWLASRYARRRKTAQPAKLKFMSRSITISKLLLKSAAAATATNTNANDNVTLAKPAIIEVEPMTPSVAANTVDTTAVDTPIADTAAAAAPASASALVEAAITEVELAVPSVAADAIDAADANVGNSVDADAAANSDTNAATNVAVSPVEPAVTEVEPVAPSVAADANVVPSVAEDNAVNDAADAATGALVAEPAVTVVEPIVTEVEHAAPSVAVNAPTVRIKAAKYSNITLSKLLPKLGAGSEVQQAVAQEKDIMITLRRSADATSNTTDATSDAASDAASDVTLAETEKAEVEPFAPSAPSVTTDVVVSSSASALEKPDNKSVLTVVAKKRRVRTKRGKAPAASSDAPAAAPVAIQVHAAETEVESVAPSVFSAAFEPEKLDDEQGWTVVTRRRRTRSKRTKASVTAQK